MESSGSIRIRPYHVPDRGPLLLLGPLAQPLLNTDPTGATACNVSGPGTIPPPGSVTPG